MGNALVCAVPICRPVQAVQIGALPCGFHASSATGGAWSPPHEQNAQDIMMSAPSVVEQKQLDELHIAIVGEVEKDD